MTSFGFSKFTLFILLNGPVNLVNSGSIQVKNLIYYPFFKKAKPCPIASIILLWNSSIAKWGYLSPNKNTR